MDTIISYLNNMFASFPKTKQIQKIKNDLAINMEEKYNELKKQGKSENEAIGIVISEFGNINELVNALGVQLDEDKVLASQDDVDGYLKAKKKSGFIIGIGVMLCILAPALLILITQLAEDDYILPNARMDVIGILGVVPLFVLVAIAVGMFIYSDMRLAKYKFLEKDATLPTIIRQNLKQELDRFIPTHTISVIMGVALCILSPVVLILLLLTSIDAKYGVVILLAIISIAVFIFIYFGTIKESFEKLLVPDVKKSTNKKADKIIEVVASLVWPLTAFAYLLMGFLKGWWHPGWIIFPIVGVIFGTFTTAVQAFVKDEQNR